MCKLSMPHFYILALEHELDGAGGDLMIGQTSMSPADTAERGVTLMGLNEL